MAETAKERPVQEFKVPAGLTGAAPPSASLGAEIAPVFKVGGGLNNLQKAAILLISISQEDPNLVSEIYRKLNKKYLRFVIQEVSRLNFVDHNTMARVIHEFYEVFIEKSQMFGGKQVAQNIVQNLFGEEDAQSYFFERGDQFKLLAEMPTRELFTMLSQEHPQFAALILSSIDSAKASETLELFSDKERVDLTKRMLNLEPPILPINELERGLEGYFSQREMQRMGETANIQRVATILDDIAENERIPIIRAIEAEFPSKVKQMKKMLFAFSDLRHLPDNYLQYILSEVRDMQLLATALKGIDRDLLEKLQANMSARMREMLTEEIELLGQDVEQNAVEQSRKTLVGYAKTFASERNISLSELVPQDAPASNGVTS